MVGARAVPCSPVWPPEAIEFLSDLESNNEREWFRANRARYDEHLLAPARELAEELSDFGEPRFFRPYNDTRFHMRPPMKEQLGLAIGYAGAGGFYVELSLDGLLVAAGLHRPAADQLARFRAAVDEPRHAKSFERALAAARRAGLQPAEPTLKRAPRGYPVDHPRIDRLRMRELTVHRRQELGAWLHEPACRTAIREGLEGARPLVTWLSKTVGPSQRPETTR